LNIIEWFIKLRGVPASWGRGKTGQVATQQGIGKGVWEAGEARWSLAPFPTQLPF